MDINRLRALAGIQTDKQILTEGLWADMKKAFNDAYKPEEINHFTLGAEEALKLLEEVEKSLKVVAKYFADLYSKDGSPLQGYTEYKEDLKVLNSGLSKVFGIWIKLSDDTNVDSEIFQRKNKKFALGFLRELFGQIKESQEDDDGEIICEGKIRETSDLPSRDPVATPQMKKIIDDCKKNYIKAAKILYKLEEDLADHFGEGRLNHSTINKDDEIQLNKTVSEFSKILDYFEDFVPFMEALQVPVYVGKTEEEED